MESRMGFGKRLRSFSAATEPNGSFACSCTDLKAMPIEDASVRWPEERSPYLPVARITAPSQVAWSEARSAIVDDRLAFNPWHGLTAHRPIGSIMRARKMAYRQSALARAQRNGCTMIEAKTAVDLTSET
jgi:hypothetical protein